MCLRCCRHHIHMVPDRNAAYAAVDQLAVWSDWASFATAAPVAPLTPGVYQMRTRDGVIVYVGMAGERRGQGLRGRLSIYRRGRGPVSGFGEAALDRALGNAAFIEEHLAGVRAGQPVRASVWAQDAIRWLDVEIRWAECATQDTALALESAAVEMLKNHSIWNRVASRVQVQKYPKRTPPSSVSHSGGGLDLAVGEPTTVTELTRQLGREDGGRAVRKALRTGFPDHPKGESWDPLTSAQVAHVSKMLSR